MKNKIRNTILAYFLNILIFASIYWLAWKYNPSYFIVNDQYNEQTIRPYFLYPDLDDLRLSSSKFVSITEINLSLEPYFDSLKFYNASLIVTGRALDSIKKADSINTIRVISSYDKNFNNYFIEKTTPIQKSKDSIKTIVNKKEQSLKLLNSDDSMYYKLNTEISKLIYEASLLDVKLSEARYKAYSCGLSKMASFYDDSLSKISTIFNDSIIELYKAKSYLWDKISSVKGKISSIASFYYEERSKRLNYFDFLYFSIISSTSTGYGDILPNVVIIRILVSAQIIISLFIFGFIFYFISNNNKFRQNSDDQ